LRIIKEEVTCGKCKHTFTFEYPEKHGEIKIPCPNCSAVGKLPKTKGKTGLVLGIIIGVLAIIGLAILVWQSCVGGSTLC